MNQVVSLLDQKFLLKHWRELCPQNYERALTHRSANSDHNERLEFLGDAILNAFVADALFKKFPKAREGELTRARATLVCEGSLAQFAHEMDLSTHLIVGPGELKSGGYRRDSVLADAFEALIAAVYLEQGWSVIYQTLTLVFETRLTQLKLQDAQKDPKTELQEWLQARGLMVPGYTLLASSGDDHNKYFELQCHTESFEIVTTGSGSTRKRAETEAAEKLLKLLKENHR